MAPINIWIRGYDNSIIPLRTHPRSFGRVRYASSQGLLWGQRWLECLPPQKNRQGRCAEVINNEWRGNTCSPRWHPRTRRGSNLTHPFNGRPFNSNNRK
ncbi:unnamed protein product [Nesidiocoris tenuis]|uniref:Uncharacterized protein n=1 Tax=Nesidiocoris tenuis TaxID=355587 RepID=A0A6H5GV50_9HEMI|nr:unnamed protein product [Nesidiocoris tenuis]